MTSCRLTNVLLALIVGVLLALWARLPSHAAAADEPGARRPVFGDYVGFAVDNGGFFILDPSKNQLYHYDRRGRMLQVYGIQTLGEDLKVTRGHGAAGE